MMKWDETADVVVVGSGAAGLCAAIEAAMAGASVIVIEKMKLAGGNTRISDGGLSAAGNFLQKKRGVKDSPKRLINDMRKAGLDLNHLPLLSVVAEKGAEALDWTRKVLGVRYQDRLDRFGGHSVARSVTTKSHCGVDIVNAQIRTLMPMGIAIRTRTRLTDLVADPTGRICGVKTLSGYNFSTNDFESKTNLRAKKAVVLATGGFGSDVAFRMEQNPVLDASMDSTNHRGATAEGVVAALRQGAAAVHLPYIQTGPWGCVDEKGYGKGGRFAAYSIYPCGILVDPATGRRIVNEWADRKQRSEAIIATRHPCLGIVDVKGALQDSESLGTCLKHGKVKPFETLKELATAYGVDSTELEKTVGAYNAGVQANATDAFGKLLGRSATPVARPPFYAIRLWPKVHYTCGGVRIDDRARVLDARGRPIKGLFAAGEVCGGIHGADRLGGCALTECIVFGRIAGRAAGRGRL